VALDEPAAELSVGVSVTAAEDDDEDDEPPPLEASEPGRLAIELVIAASIESDI